jgi:hypothetical protein
LFAVITFVLKMVSTRADEWQGSVANPPASVSLTVALKSSKVLPRAMASSSA